MHGCGTREASGVGILSSWLRPRRKASARQAGVLRYAAAIPGGEKILAASQSAFRMMVATPILTPFLRRLAGYALAQVDRLVPGSNHMDRRLYPARTHGGYRS
jgi:hypothetical protein